MGSNQAHGSAQETPSAHKGRAENWIWGGGAQGGVSPERRMGQGGVKPGEVWLASGVRAQGASSHLDGAGPPDQPPHLPLVLGLQSDSGAGCTCSAENLVHPTHSGCPAPSPPGSLHSSLCPAHSPGPAPGRKCQRGNLPRPPGRPRPLITQQPAARSPRPPRPRPRAAGPAHSPLGQHLLQPFTLGGAGGVRALAAEEFLLSRTIGADEGTRGHLRGWREEGEGAMSGVTVNGWL
jgi:hypothetical protein